MRGLFNSVVWLRLARAGLLAAIIALIYGQSQWLADHRDPPISLRIARKYFPAANRVQLRDFERGIYFVLDGRNEAIGCLLTTSPQTDDIIGYSGPTDLLLALDARGAIAGVELLHSGDTHEHVEKVRHDPHFLASFIGWKPGQKPPKIEGVSGATLTSYAIAEIIQKRLGGAAPSLRFPEPVTLAEVQGLFTNAARMTADATRFRVTDGRGQLLGYVARTSPEADNVSGYRGPTECLVGLAPDGRTITGIRVHKSFDTDSYVESVARNEKFLSQFIGKKVEDLAISERSGDRIEGVSGATLTSRAITEGVRNHFAAELGLKTQKQPWRPKGRDWALAAVIAGAFVMAFSSLRGDWRARWAWQLVLVGYVGIVNHDLLSLALLGGWAANGVALKAAPALVLLAAAALLVPWISRRQLYCHQICPHGAAQQLLGKVRLLFPKRPASPPRASTQFQKFERALENLPGVLLGVALVTVLTDWGFNLANLEPFDAYVWKTAGVAAIVIAVAGLVASLFVPQAYCRFGCPTGAVLSFVRSSGSADRWGRRDWGALALCGLALLTVISARGWTPHPVETEPLTLRGRTMGTTWTVKLRDEVGDTNALQRAITDEFDWVESLTSHWRSNTDISIFNRSRSTDPMPVPWPVLTLSRWAADISRQTDGAYDVTVGAMVKLWGFGPAPRRTEPPSEAEIQSLLPSVGWEKLDVLDGMVRKRDSRLELDLSSIVPGWAIDRVADYLDRKGYGDFLIESGGELRARGRWKIAIEHPDRTCTLTNESIGASGTYRQNFKFGGREYSHLIDPRTGRPVAHRTVAVQVRFRDCAHADAWACALNVMGVETGLPLAERLKIAAQFVIQQEDGTLAVKQTTSWHD